MAGSVVSVSSLLLDHPQAIEARLLDLGLVVRRNGMVMSLPDLYSRVLDVDGREDVLVHAQLTASPDSGLQVSLRGYFDQSQWPATLALLQSLLDSLHTQAGRTTPAALCDALRSACEAEFIDDGNSYAVCFPEQEPDADLELIDVSLSRALDTGEWQDWLAQPPMANLLAADRTRKEAVLALCRKRLEDAGHPLAVAELHVLSAIGNAENGLFTIMAPASEAVLFCDLADTGGLSISLVDAHGRQTKL